MSKESQEKSRANNFKKGNTPHNHLPVGHIRTIKEGYLSIKIAEPNKWELLHRMNWMIKNGPIPKGNIISFKDGNKLNCDIGNLKMISFGDNMRRNTIHQYPEDLKQTIRTLSKLKKQIENGKEQNI